MGLIENFRGTLLSTVTKVLIVAFLGVTAYNLVSFTQSTRDAVNRSFSDSAAADLYGLSDHLTDPDAFEQYRSSSDNIRKIARFYDNLQSDRSLEVLSAFDQNLPIVNFEGGETFEYGYGTEMALQGPHLDESLGGVAVNVKSMQMNQAAFEFYNLTDAAGKAFDWESIDYSNPSTPVLLGSNYRGVYEIGDRLTGNLYSRVARFEVVGFLEPNSSMFYQNDLNFYLDDYVLIPYPQSIEHFPETEAYFYGILAFAMINANVAVDTGTSPDVVLSTLATAGNQSGFDAYALINVPSYITQFALVRNLILDNLGLLVTIEIALIIGSIVAIVALTRFNHRRRSQRVRALWMLGRRGSALSGTALATTVIEYAAIAVALVFLIQRLPNQDSTSGLLITAGVFVLFLLDAIWQQRLVKTTILGTGGKTA